MTNRPIGYERVYLSLWTAIKKLPSPDAEILVGALFTYRTNFYDLLCHTRSHMQHRIADIRNRKHSFMWFIILTHTECRTISNIISDNSN